MLYSPEQNTLKNLNISEGQIQDLIAQNPSILGLGDIVLLDRERKQNNAGRLDLLLQNPETKKRFEVEIQLGKIDESHIIRTIEYWDIERKRYPQYKHTAVIVAEEINARFFNVIQLLNGNIPLIALKLSAFKIENKIAITFTKVLDEVEFGFVDDDEEKTEIADIEYWEQRSSPPMISLFNKIFELVQKAEPSATAKYNKYYIGTALRGITRNFVYFRPRKNLVQVVIKLEQNEELDNDINQSLLDFSHEGNEYRIQITTDLSEQQRDLLSRLITQAREQYDN